MNTTATTANSIPDFSAIENALHRHIAAGDVVLPSALTMSLKDDYRLFLLSSGKPREFGKTFLDRAKLATDLLDDEFRVVCSYVMETLYRKKFEKLLFLNDSETHELVRAYRERLNLGDRAIGENMRALESIATKIIRELDPSIEISVLAR